MTAEEKSDGFVTRLRKFIGRLIGHHFYLYLPPVLALLVYLILFIALQFNNDDSFNGFWLAVFMFMIFSFISPIVYFAYSKPTNEKTALTILSWFLLYFALAITYPCIEGCTGESAAIYNVLLRLCPGTLFVGSLLLMGINGSRQSRRAEPVVGEFIDNAQPQLWTKNPKLLFYSAGLGVISLIAGGLLLLLWLFSERWVMGYDYLIWPILFLGVGIGLIVYRVWAGRKS